MQANPRSIDSLFNSQLRYIVPMFQRHYVWQQNPQWSTLWEDVVEKADFQIEGRQTTAHYLGALIIEGVRPTSPREVKRFLIVDGQQRLITLQLLLCAFRDIARAKSWETLKRTTSRLVENPDADVMEHPEEERYKVWPTQLNRSVFTDIIDAGSVDGVRTKFPLIKLPRRRKPEPRSNLVEAYLYFSGEITAWLERASIDSGFPQEDCAFRLLQAIQQDFSVVEIALSEGDDSQEIFYSLNSQGRPLSQSDLLRSLVFMRAEKERIDRDRIFEDYWSNFESEFWSTETRRGGRAYSRLDIGLRFFLMAKTGEMVDARRVNEEYRRWVTVSPPRYSSVRDEIADFTRHAEVYKRYETAPPELPASDLRRVVRDIEVTTSVPLLQFLELECELSDVQLASCLRITESFLVRRAIVGADTKDYNKFFVTVIDALIGVSPEKIEETLVRKLTVGTGATRSWPTDEEIIESVVSKPLYTNLRVAALRLLLERIEIALRTRKSESDAVAGPLQVEHIMPQGWWTDWPLDGFRVPWNVVQSPWQATGELSALEDRIRQRNQIIHTLGNLTLVNGYLNSTARNSSFEVKQQEYKHSVLQLNRYFDGCAVWDEETIRNRGRLLGKMVCDIWRRPATM